jgi:predicted DNA binding CopG/RHH family protein
MKTSKRASKSKGQADPLDQDLSALLSHGEWQRVRYELRPKNKTVTIRMSEELLDAVKEKAKESGLDYQKFIRIALEHIVQKAS